MVVEAAEYIEAKGNDFVFKKPVHIALKSSAFPLERKDVTNATLGTATSGVLVQQRLPGVVGMPHQALRIRDVMNVVPQVTGNSFDYVYQDTRTNAASPQVEGNAKAESNLKWSSASGSIRTIAHFVDVSRQALNDIPWLRGQVDGELTYGLKVKEEAEILSGDDTGEHLPGVITKATAFDTAYLSATAGWTRLDILRYAKLQARLAGLATYAPSAFVLNPTDLAEIELTKDGEGRYVVGDPKTGVEVTYIWGLPTVESDSIAAGTFLVGAFRNAADLVDRQAVSIEISYEHGTNFTSNMATILCEERVGLAIKKATAFISGSFSTSPA
jgi:HK97 family phage major capsid protein